jgi:hypothetical protein
MNYFEKRNVKDEKRQFLRQLHPNHRTTAYKDLKL